MELSHENFFTSFQAEEQNVNDTSNWELIRKKIIEIDSLIKTVNKYREISETLNKEISTLKEDKQDIVKKYNEQLEKVTKLEIENNEHKKSNNEYVKLIEEYKEIIDSTQLKLNENDKHIDQLKHKNLSLEDAIKNLEQENIKSMKSKTLKKKPDVSLNHQACQTDNIAKPTLKKPKMRDKSILTDECRDIKTEPFPIFCSKCKTHIKPAPLDHILKIMSATPPPVLSDDLSPPNLSKSDRSSNNVYGTTGIDIIDIQDDNKEVFNNNLVSVLNDENKFEIPINFKEESKFPSFMEIDKLTRKVNKLENFMKKANKNKQHNCCNQLCCSSKNIKFIVKLPDEKNLMKYKGKQKNKIKLPKRLNYKIRNTSTSNWQIENFSEQMNKKVMSLKEKIRFKKKLTSHNNEDKLFQSPQILVPNVISSIAKPYSKEEDSPLLNLPCERYKKSKTDLNINENILVPNVNEPTLFTTNIICVDTSQSSVYKNIYPNILEKKFVGSEENFAIIENSLEKNCVVENNSLVRQKIESKEDNSYNSPFFNKLNTSEVQVEEGTKSKEIQNTVQCDLPSQLLLKPNETCELEQNIHKNLELSGGTKENFEVYKKITVHQTSDLISLPITHTNCRISEIEISKPAVTTSIDVNLFEKNQNIVMEKHKLKNNIIESSSNEKSLHDKVNLSSTVVSTLSEITSTTTAINDEVIVKTPLTDKSNTKQVEELIKNCNRFDNENNEISTETDNSHNSLTYNNSKATSTSLEITSTKVVPNDKTDLNRDRLMRKNIINEQNKCENISYLLNESSDVEFPLNNTINVSSNNFNMNQEHFSKQNNEDNQINKTCNDNSYSDCNVDYSSREVMSTISTLEKEHAFIVKSNNEVSLNDNINEIFSCSSTSDIVDKNISNEENELNTFEIVKHELLLKTTDEEDKPITSSFNDKSEKNNSFTELSNNQFEKEDLLIKLSDISEKIEHSKLSTDMNVLSPSPKTKHESSSLNVSDKSFDEDIVEEIPIKRRRRDTDKNKKPNLRIGSRKKLLTNIRNLKKNSKIPITNFKSESRIPYIQQSIMAPSNTSVKLPLESIKDDTSEFVENVADIIPTKKQRIAHTPRSPAKQNIESEKKTVRKTKSIKSVQQKEDDNSNDKVSSILEAIDKTCEERAKILQKSRSQKFLPSKSINFLDIVKNFQVSNLNSERKNLIHDDKCVNLSLSTSPNQSSVEDLHSMDTNKVNVVTENISQSSETSCNEINTTNSINIVNNKDYVDNMNMDDSYKSELVNEKSVNNIKNKNSIRELRSRQILLSKETSEMKKIKSNFIPESINETNSSLFDSTVVLSLNQCIFSSVSPQKCKLKNGDIKKLKENEHFVNEQLLMLINAEEWTTKISTTIANNLMNAQDLKTIALYLIEFAVKNLREDEEFDKLHTPPAPMMTKSEQKLVELILRINKKHSVFINIILQGIQYKLFRLGKPYQAQIVERLFRIFVVLNKIKKDRENVRIAICDAFYCSKLRAINILDVALLCWPEILPKFGSNNDILVKTIVYIVMTQQMEIPIMMKKKLNLLRKRLFTYYEYPNSGYMINSLTEELLRSFQENVPGVRTAILLLCKKMGPEWSSENITIQLKNILVSQVNSRPSLYEELTLLGNILRSSSIENPTNVNTIIDQLCDVLSCNSGSDDLQEGIVSCLLSISKFNYEKIARSVMMWQFNKNLRPTTQEKLNSFFKLHDRRWWWKFIKINFPLPK